MPFLSTRSDGKLPKITLVYVPQGSYRRTQLDGLAFTYVHKELSDPRSCEDFAKIRSDNPQATFERTINRTIFKVANGGDLSGGHTIKARSFSTYRNGQCYAFEQDFMTSTHHGRPLTEVEADALQNQLNMLMESVQIPRM